VQNYKKIPKKQKAHHYVTKVTNTNLYAKATKMLPTSYNQPKKTTITTNKINHTTQNHQNNHKTTMSNKKTTKTKTSKHQKNQPSKSHLLTNN